MVAEQCSCEERKRDVAEKTMSVMVKLANEIDEPYDIDLPTAECQSRTPFPRKGGLHAETSSGRARGARFDVENEAFQEKDGHMDESRSVKDRAEDTNERVVTSHGEMCEQSAEGCEVTSEEEGHDVEFENDAKESQEAKHKEVHQAAAALKCQSCDRIAKINGLTKANALLVKGMMRERFFQNGKIVVILKQSKDEMSADLTTFKKKGSDRKTNHQDLVKIETEEIFV